MIFAGPECGENQNKYEWMFEHGCFICVLNFVDCSIFSCSALSEYIKISLITCFPFFSEHLFFGNC